MPRVHTHLVRQQMCDGKRAYLPPEKCAELFLGQVACVKTPVDRFFVRNFVTIIRLFVEVLDKRVLRWQRVRKQRDPPESLSYKKDKARKFAVRCAPFEAGTTKNLEVLASKNLKCKRHTCFMPGIASTTKRETPTQESQHWPLTSPHCRSTQPHPTCRTGRC